MRTGKLGNLLCISSLCDSARCKRRWGTVKSVDEVIAETGSDFTLVAPVCS